MRFCDFGDLDLVEDLAAALDAKEKQLDNQKKIIANRKKTLANQKAQKSNRDTMMKMAKAD